MASHYSHASTVVGRRWRADFWEDPTTVDTPRAADPLEMAQLQAVDAPFAVVVDLESVHEADLN